MNIILLLFLFNSLKNSESAKILGMFTLAGRSVNILTNKLMVALANAGHDVTVIAAHKPKENIQNGTLRYIHLTGFWEDYDNLVAAFNPWNLKEESNMLRSKNFINVLGKSYDRAFKIPEVKELLTSNETFDAVIIEDLWNDCFKILRLIFNCPLIVFTSIGGNNNYLNAVIGNPLPSSYIPHLHKVGPYINGMTFIHRVHNFIIYLVDTLMRYFHLLPVHNQILKSHFENPADIETYYNNISLILLGSHSSLRQAGPLLPNVIEIGGFHIDPPKKLPKDLQEFLDGAKDGAIYFSLGSNCNSKDLPIVTKKTLLKIFKKLKQRVLWKFEEELPDKPQNVLIKDWLPQADILAHPNIKLFITHGGHGSILETVYHGVPCLVMPLFLDQFHMGYVAVQKGFGLKISYKDENESTLLKTIEELLYNPKYTDNAKKIQFLFHDRPMKPIDTAIYWIEYIIRNKGADHLKVAGLNMPWYQFHSIDVIIFLLGCIFVILYMWYLCLKTIFVVVKGVDKQKIQ